jgi:programmed cell death 6-interacting protein
MSVGYSHTSGGLTLHKWKRKFHSSLRSLHSPFADLFISELVSGMSSLNLDTAASLHQQKQKQKAESRQSAVTLGQASKQVPLAAPQPTRAPSAQATGMWNPEMGIRFGGAAGGATKESGTNGTEGGTTKENKWDPSKGLKFS